MDGTNAGRKIRYVAGPDGSPLTLNDLPGTTPTRWVPRRKAQIVAAVRGGLLSLEDALGRYDLTIEEFLNWQESLDREGLKGLKATTPRR